MCRSMSMSPHALYIPRDPGDQTSQRTSPCSTILMTSCYLGDKQQEEVHTLGVSGSYLSSTKWKRNSKKTENHCSNTILVIVGYLLSLV